MKYFYEKTDYDKFKSNIFYDDILGMDECQFTAWVKLLRLEVIQNWNNGIPPVVGKNEIDIIKSFRKMRQFFTPELILPDKDCLGIIRNFNKCGSECNQFFPTMLKTKITTGKNPNKAKSIYDVISKDSFLDSFIRIMKRALKRDSMYIYSKSLTKQTNDEEICYMGGNGYKWVVDNIKKLTNYGIWLNEEDDCGDEYVYLTKSDINHLMESNHITNKELTNIGELDPDKKYLIRYYKKNQPIFPGIIQIFRLSLGTQPVVNFSPLTAKLLYEKYTEHIKDQDVINIYDPSAGWGGRILGAMSLSKRVHYIGTDPNTDNYIEELGISRYEYLADFYNEKCIDSTNEYFNAFFESNDNKNTYDIYPWGSENMHLDPDFQKYKGNIDLVFTSPPYFNKEQYGKSHGQSYIQYPRYEDWKNNFLKPTLTTAVEYLKNDRYLLWNIANLKVGSDVCPLESDSKKILEELGMEYIGYYKMLMTRMLGLKMNKILNCVKINGELYKYEPVFVHYKYKLN